MGGGVCGVYVGVRGCARVPVYVEEWLWRLRKCASVVVAVVVVIVAVALLLLLVVALIVSVVVVDCMNMPL